MMHALSHAALLVDAILFASLWLGALSIAVVWFGLRCLPSIGAPTRYAVWLVTLVAIALLPAITVPSLDASGAHHLALRNARTAPVAAPIDAPMRALGGASAHPTRFLLIDHRDAPPLHVAMPSPGSAAPIPLRARIWVPQWMVFAFGALWMFVVFFKGTMLALDLRALMTMRREASPWSSSFAFPVLLSARAAVPLALGFAHPAIILPASLVIEQSPEVVDAIIAHESAHLRRYDVWSNAFARLLDAVLAFNPAAWFVLRRLSVEREIACDDWVVMQLQAGDVFARALAFLATRARPHTRVSAPGALGSRHSIVERIERLFDPRPRRLRISLSTLGGSATLFAIIALFTNSFSPVFAYTPQPPVHATRVLNAFQMGSSCASPNRGVRWLSATYTHNRAVKSWLSLPTFDQLKRHVPVSAIATAEITVDASGHARKILILAAPDGVGIPPRFQRTLLLQQYEPALRDCVPVASTVSTGFVFLASKPVTLSIVTPVYPQGWTRHYPSACKVPAVLHGDVPPFPSSLKLAEHKDLRASVRVRVDSSGRVSNATIVSSSGYGVFDRAVLGVARAATYPLDVASGFKPVRPSGATLEWNATHGYDQYSKCEPPPTTYVWSTTYEHRTVSR